HDQHGPGEAASKPADADRPLVRIDTRHFDPGREAERFRNGGGARAPDIIAGYDIDGGWGLERSLRLFGRCGDFNLRELLQAQVFELIGSGSSLWLAPD